MCKEMKDDANKIKWQLIHCILLLLLAIAFPVAAYYSILIPDKEPANMWFQRSGSLSVLFAVWVEYKLYKINEDANPPGLVSGQSSSLNKKHKGIYTKIQYIAVIFAVFGAFIWGYGDIVKTIT